MKINTLPFSLLAGLLLFGSVVYAQPGSDGPGGGMPPGGMSQRKLPSPEEMASRETKWMKKKLKLTDAQQPAVEALNIQFAARRSEVVQAVMKSGQMPTPTDLVRMQTAVEAIQAEKEQQLKPLLTDEQWTVYQKKKDGFSQDMGTGQPPMSRGAMPGGGSMPRQQ